MRMISSRPAAPVITEGPTVLTITRQSIVIRWVTDEAATSVIEYGMTDALGGVEMALDAPRPDQVLISRGMEAIVRAEIEALPERYRLAARFRFVEELSYHELAHELQLPMGTVKVRLHRGRQHLRERLAWLGNWS